MADVWWVPSSMLQLVLLEKDGYPHFWGDFFGDEITKQAVFGKICTHSETFFYRNLAEN